MEADESLKNSSGEAFFGKDNYYISFLGKPSNDEPWIIQFGGTADNPDPLRLYRQFEPLLQHLGLDRYRMQAGAPDYVQGFRETMEVKYG